MQARTPKPVKMGYCKWYEASCAACEAMMKFKEDDDIVECQNCGEEYNTDDLDARKIS